MKKSCTESISVALATYNGEKFLREQLDSLLNQTLPFSELVICDDCSSDATLSILQEYAARDSRIKVIANEQNLGFRRNFEKAIRLCEGDLIALCDQDDVWLPEHLAVLAGNIEGCLLTVGASIITDSEGKTDGIRLSFLKNYETRSGNPEDVFRFVMFYQNPFQGASMMMRREFRAYALPVPSSVAYHDVWFVHLASILREFRFVDVPVTLYRLHGANTSGNHKRTPRLRTLIGHTLHRTLTNNRTELALELSKLRRVIPSESLPLLEDALRYYSSRSLSRRLSNLIFELKNYKSIYGTCQSRK